MKLVSFVSVRLGMVKVWDRGVGKGCRHTGQDQMKPDYCVHPQIFNRPMSW